MWRRYTISQTYVVTSTRPFEYYRMYAYVLHDMKKVTMRYVSNACVGCATDGDAVVDIYTIAYRIDLLAVPLQL